MDTRVQSGLRLRRLPHEDYEDDQEVRMDTRVQSGLRHFFNKYILYSFSRQNGYPRSERIKTAYSCITDEEEKLCQNGYPRSERIKTHISQVY